MTVVREHDRGSEIVTEIRVWCTDRSAWLRFRPVWLLVAPFMRFVRMRSAAHGGSGRPSAELEDLRGDLGGLAPGHVDRSHPRAACASR